MDVEECKCAICGLSSADYVNFANVRLSSGAGDSVKKQNILEKWKNECSKSICEILFKSDPELFLLYFQNGEYCFECEQKIRDLHFTWKQIKLFQNQMEKYSKEVCALIQSNYTSLEKKSDRRLVDERVSMLRDGFTENYSYGETVEMIYLVAQKSGFMDLAEIGRRRRSTTLSLGDQTQKPKPSDPRIQTESVSRSSSCSKPEVVKFLFGESRSVRDIGHSSENAEEKEMSNDEFDESGQMSDASCIEIDDTESVSSGSSTKEKKLPKVKIPRRHKGRQQLGTIHDLNLSDPELEILRKLSTYRQLIFYNLNDEEKALVTKVSDCTKSAVEKSHLSELEKKFIFKVRLTKGRRVEIPPPRVLMAMEKKKLTPVVPKTPRPRGRPESGTIFELHLTEAELATIEKLSETKTVMFNKLSESDNALLEKVGNCTSSAIRKLNLNEREKGILFKMKKHKLRQELIKKCKEQFNMVV